MHLDLGAHAPEECLERYAMRSMSETEAESLEDHLMFCQQCQEALASVEAFQLVARQASRQVKRESAHTTMRESNWIRLSRFLGVSQHPGKRSPSWLAMPAAGIALAGLAIFLAMPAPRDVAYRQVRLEARRGVEAGVVRSDKPLEIQLNLTGLAETSGFRVDVVTAQGETIDRTQAEPSGDVITVRLKSKLTPGQYWVRVHASGSEETLREFSLRTN